MNNNPFPKTQKPAFALVVTLSLMILLTVIAVGMLSLSAISLRTSSQSYAMGEARANARLALMLAIGDLQKQTGADTRVTARADVLNAANPPVVGAWKSWQGDDHELTGAAIGRPKSPGNEYRLVKKNRFQGWLVSGPPGAAPNSDELPSTAKDANTVTLVGAGAVGATADPAKSQIHLAPTRVRNDQGAFAWWVTGENQKARISKPYMPDPNTPAGWATQMKGHSVANPEPFRLEGLLQTPSVADKIISLSEADLVATPAALKTSAEFFHDVSTSSTGLLTNTATGGWRKDFSLFSENQSLVTKTNMPLFQLKPGEDALYNWPALGGNYQPNRSLLYPWSDYRSKSNTYNIFETGAVSSWASLVNFATSYKAMASNGSVMPIQYSFTDENDATKDYNYHHQTRILPLVARIQWVYSHWAASPPSGSAANTLEPRLLVTPVFTLWNPYNVKISYNIGAGNQETMTFWQRATLPVALRYTVNGIQNGKYNSILSSSNHVQLNFNDSRGFPWGSSLLYSIKSSFVLNPGQTLLFSPIAAAATPDVELELQPGYRSTGGHYFSLMNDAGAKLIAPISANIAVDAKFDSVGQFGVGLYLDVLTKPGTGTNYTKRNLAYRMVVDPAIASQVYPSIGSLLSTTLAEAKITPQPFMTTILGSRTGSNTHLPSKGFVQTNPLGNYAEMGRNAQAGDRRYPGDSHPVNSLFDFSFKSLTAASDFTPNNGPGNSGCIITGFQSATGLHRCVLSELPSRPIQSLAELTSWDARLDNPKPPFSYNSIANSDASPLFSKTAVWNPANSGEGNKDLQHDDSYCLNHLLFDDWFASSLAPNSTTLGVPSGGASLKKTYEDFLTGKSSLPNRSYKALSSDVSSATSSAANLNNLYDKQVNTANSWRTIASRLDVEGMFNVNSTSVQAWRSLLGHARGQKIPYFDASSSPTLSSDTDHAVTRFSVSGDVEALSSNAISGSFPGAAQFTGYRKLDDAWLLQLAEEIVKQVRLRGPFLSLSEFVNRQLSSDDTLAIGGAIQVALDTMAKSTATNIYSKLQAPGTLASANPPLLAQAGYLFPAAAEGYNAYGLPGWTRQADILRPIAPILSARDDTFTIRSYGDARNAAGNITAKAVCEAVVRRSRDYVDPADAADIMTLPTRATNVTFGRRYDIVSFRWLNPSEI